MTPRGLVAGGVVAAATIAAVLLLAGAGAPGVAACTGAGAVDFDCQQRRALAIVRADGPRAALVDLGERMQESGYVRAACHQLSHSIGRAAGTKAGIGAFEQGDRVCASGYYHGVTEGVMSKLGPSRSVREAPAVCADLRPRAVDRTNCIHGMGHGFMRVLEGKLEPALQGCDGLDGRDRDREECYSGVFMENLAAVDDPRRGSLRADEPLYPCTAVDRPYKEACYDRQSTYALLVNDGDFGAVFELCAATERDFRGACLRGLGGDVAAETKTIADRVAQARSRRRLCRLGAGVRARAECISGAAVEILEDLDGGPAQLDALCGSLEAVATQPEHAACLRAGEQAYRSLLAEQIGRDRGAQPAGLDFVCHLRKPGRRRLN